jgi:hypothetical protein
MIEDVITVDPGKIRLYEGIVIKKENHSYVLILNI